MREIKCKAWNRVTKRMWWFDVTWGNTANAGEGWIGMLESSTTPKRTPNGNDNRVQVDGDDCDIVFSTGLKDKNGVEIYEGDVVVLGQSDAGVVVWQDDVTGFAWVHPDIDPADVDMSEDGLGSFETKQLEIIGNIYENGDLLNEVD